MLPLLSDISKYRSVSVVGLSKNAGKTVCLNYLIRNLVKEEKKIAVTSIGVDGEATDVFSGHAKPDISIYEGMIFVTSETHYRCREVLSEILDFGPGTTALGRPVIARALDSGQVILSGPSGVDEIKKLNHRLEQLGVDTILIDGALSRLSSASPVVTEAMILVIGASTAPDLDNIARKARYIYDLIGLPQTRNERAWPESGSWAITPDGEFVAADPGQVNGTDDYFVSGALTGKMLDTLRGELDRWSGKLVIRDFTRIFADESVFRSYIRRGGRIEVTDKPVLLGVCVNPHNPSGRSYDAEIFSDAVSNALGIEVTDLKRLDKDAFQGGCKHLW